jgi:hypothetical protein
LVARTVKVYGTPLVSPLMVHLVAPVVVHVRAGDPDDATVYPVMADPPSVGAFHAMVAAPSDGVATTPVGAPGAVGTTNAADACDGNDVPAVLVAVAVHVYVRPAVSDATVMVVPVPEFERVVPLPVQVTVYRLMGAPPSDVGAVSDAVALVPATVIGARPHPGASGAVMGATAVKFQPSELAPLAPFTPSMAIMYVVPLVAAKVMVRYVWPVGDVPVAFVVSEATDPPV